MIVVVAFTVIVYTVWRALNPGQAGLYGFSVLRQLQALGARFRMVIFDPGR